MSDSTYIDQLADEIMAEHLLRLDLCNTVPLKRRGKRIKRRPNTALISLAANELVESRQENCSTIIYSLKLKQ